MATVLQPERVASKAVRVRHLFRRSNMSTRVRIGTSALEVAPLALGANVFGWTAGRNESFAVLDGFAAGGGDFIDTADGYSAWAPGNSGGESETIIGEWLRARGSRDAVTVATKVSTHPEFTGLAAANVRAAADASLARLQTDRIDLYYAHFDDAETPLEETVAAFSGLVDAGKIRAIGVSNYTAERVAEWFAIARAGGYHLPVALQPHYNLLERDFETNGLRDVAAAEQLAVFPYFGLAKGFLAGSTEMTPPQPRPVRAHAPPRPSLTLTTAAAACSQRSTLSPSVRASKSRASRSRGCGGSPPSAARSRAPAPRSSWPRFSHR